MRDICEDTEYKISADSCKQPTRISRKQSTDIVRGVWSCRVRSHLFGVGEGVGAAVVGDGDVALLNVNVGRPILAHSAQLHQVAVRLELLRTKRPQSQSISRHQLAFTMPANTHSSQANAAPQQLPHWLQGMKSNCNGSARFSALATQ